MTALTPTEAKIALRLAEKDITFIGKQIDRLDKAAEKLASERRTYVLALQGAQERLADAREASNEPDGKQ